MPVLAAFLASCLASLVEFFAEYFTKRVAVQIAIGAAVIAAFSACIEGIDALLGALSLVLPNNINAILSWVMPDGFVECIAARMATEVLVATYQFQAKLLWGGPGKGVAF